MRPLASWPAIGRFTAALLFVAIVASPTVGQSLLERTPNLNGTVVPPPRTAQFTFLHRFQLLGEDTKKVVNYPAFTLGIGLPKEFAVGATYVSNSELTAGTPNEWELWGKWRKPLADTFDISFMGGYNTAAESVDGEITGRIRLSRVSLFGVVRGFSSAFDTGNGEAALGGGAMFHLTPRLAVGGDLARIVTRDSLDMAWSGGVHLVIPGSPHTVGFVVSNVGATTLQGASRGIEELDGDKTPRYGFVFTAPLGSFAQWAEIFHGQEKVVAHEPTVRIREFAFSPPEVRIRVGQTVRWINDDPVAHSVTADDGSFDSGLLETGEGYSRRFDKPGEFAYYCTPHPYMKAKITVEPVDIEVEEGGRKSRLDPQDSQAWASL